MAFRPLDKAHRGAFNKSEHTRCTKGLSKIINHATTTPGGASHKPGRSSHSASSRADSYQVRKPYEKQNEVQTGKISCNTQSDAF